MDEQWRNLEVYIALTPPSYWNWGEDGAATAWLDGRTIAFLPELRQVLHRLAPQGLPPIGAVLLLLAACRNNWGEPPSRRVLLVGVLESEGSSDVILMLEEVCDGLDRVHALPLDLRQSAEAKGELAALVFANSPHRLDAQGSHAVVQALDRHQGAGAPLGVSPLSAAPALKRDLGAIRDGLRRVNEQALRLRLQTGLEALPAPAPIEPPPLVGRAWIDWLRQQQDDLAGLARLAGRLMAVINIPRDLHDADELSAGGVTDITTRGPLDRLLLSELAQDDLTLAVRVAMNEALYLRRETPPRSPPRQRHILLDAGLRLWGLPRLYAAAVALALNSRPEPGLEVTAYRAAGADLEPVALHTVAGLRGHLSALDPRLHPGESLPAFAALLPHQGEGEGVVITSADTFNDRDFQRMFNHAFPSAIYLALVSRDGAFELWKQSRAGRLRIHAAQLPLEEILRDRPRTSTLRDAKQEALPAIFGATPFPLLLSVSVGPQNSQHFPKLGVLTLARDGRLLLWQKIVHGARQIAEGLPQGMIHGAARAHADSVALVIGRRSACGLCLVLVDPHGEVERRVALAPRLEHIQGVAVDSHAVFVWSHDRVESLNLHSGEVIYSWALRPGQTIRGMYVSEEVRQASQNQDQLVKWSRLKATEPGLTSVLAQIIRDDPVQEMFDAREVEGPVAVTRAGNIRFLATDVILQVKHLLPPPVTVAAVTRDRRLFVLTSGLRSMVVDTATGAARPCDNPLVAVEASIHLFARPRPLRSRFQGIAISPAGKLVLITPKKSAWTLQSPNLTFPAQATPLPQIEWRSFEIWEHEGVRGFGLHRAEFPGGQAVLDSRGLLHLQARDASLPECTIVLREGATAGWCSNGRMWGPAYFLGDRTATAAAEIDRDVIRPLLERLR